MPPFAVEEATIESIHAALRAGEISATELVQAYLERIETYDRGGPRLNSVIATSEQAIARARQLDESFADTGEPAGPLYGIPVALKDNIESEDMTTTFGSIAMDGYRPPADATVARRLRDAGAIILAKTALPGGATSWFSYSSKTGDTRNPYDLDRDPGGSSAGTGAAIAANLAAVGLGTDCGGSIRVPSSFCNLVGVRSTPGLVPRTGSSYLVIFQDTIGPMTRTVTDAATVFDAIVGYDASDPYTAAYVIARAPGSYRDQLDPGALRGAHIGLVTNALGPDDNPASAGVNAVVQTAVDAIAAAG